MNNTGFFRVSKVKSNTKNGFRFTYQVTNELIQMDIRRVNLLDLKNEVESKGLLWGIVEMNKAIAIANENGISIADLEGRYGLKMKSENGNENRFQNETGFENENQSQNENELQNHFQNENQNENELENELKMNSQKRRLNHLKKHKEETCKDYYLRQSLAHNNSSGYFRVTKAVCKRCQQGYTWKYQYYDEQGQKQVLQSTDLLKLKEKVLKKGLTWREI